MESECAHYWVQHFISRWAHSTPLFVSFLNRSTGAANLSLSGIYRVRQSTENPSNINQCHSSNKPPAILIRPKWSFTSSHSLVRIYNHLTMPKVYKTLSCPAGFVAFALAAEETEVETRTEDKIEEDDGSRVSGSITYDWHFRLTHSPWCDS